MSLTLHVVYSYNNGPLSQAQHSSRTITYHAIVAAAAAASATASAAEGEKQYETFQDNSA